MLFLAVGRYVERGEPGFAAVLSPGEEVENALLLLHDAFLLLAAVGDAFAAENRFPILLGNLDLILDRCGVAEFRLEKSEYAVTSLKLNEMPKTN